MKYKVIGILVSGNPKHFKNCIEAISNQLLPFSKILVVPWSDKQKEIKSIAAKQKIEIQFVCPSQDNTLEGNRNNALNVIEANFQGWIAFIDDDTIIRKDWLFEMMNSANKFGDRFTFASIVTHTSKPSIIQGAGHILNESRPHDCAYNRPLSEKCEFVKPLCPCGNSAFIPWKAISEISELDNEIWDPRFKQWQTCFDFGLKLRLKEFSCRLVNSAFAVPEGAYGRKNEFDQTDVLY